MKNVSLKRELMVHVNGFEQKPSLCGWASLMMILEFYGLNYGGIPINQQKLYKISGTSKKEGADAFEILAVAEEGFKLKGVVWDWCKIKDIATWLKIGVPVILNYQVEAGGHYGVAVGLKKGQIIIQDPIYGETTSYGTTNFMGKWLDYKGDYPKKLEDYITRRLIALWDPVRMPNLRPSTDRDNNHNLFIPGNLESKVQ
jgi:ABC-type bacteriocin/lantibiotic exporter with double-glycine peptidase domain